jgi:hypothetical protein
MICGLHNTRFREINDVTGQFCDSDRKVRRPPDERCTRNIIEARPDASETRDRDPSGGRVVPVAYGERRRRAAIVPYSLDVSTRLLPLTP